MTGTPEVLERLRAEFPDCGIEVAPDNEIRVQHGSVWWVIPPRMDLNLSAEIGSARAWFLHR